jgi:hypothetical protein
MPPLFGGRGGGGRSNNNCRWHEKKIPLAVLPIPTFLAWIAYPVQCLNIWVGTFFNSSKKYLSGGFI